MNYTNLTLMTDLYELTMIQGYLDTGTYNKTAVFDVFYRKNPDNNGYSIFAGLEQVVDYIENINFSDEDIEYLRSLNAFKENFFEYMKNFKFTGELYAVREGSVVFPGEPLIRVKAPIVQAQLLETTILNIVNHQSLIATKASRVKWAAGDDSVMEFGLRRAQGPDAGIYGARAAVIGGCSSTSNVLAGKMFNIPVSGTHAHSWVMSFESEIEAFRKYAQTYPDKCIFLVDTYDTLNSGIPNAIQVMKELRQSGVELKNYGIRLDSGDFAYLSKKARKLLDDAGFNDAIICASSDLDENLISSLKLQKAEINLWGVGTNLITSKDTPAFGGVYKLVALEEEGELVPKIKISENFEKITNPGEKNVYRLIDRETGKMKADLICFEDEEIDENNDLTIFHPSEVWKKMTLKKGSFIARKQLIPVYLQGKSVYERKTVTEIQKFCNEEKNLLWEEHKRLVNPHKMPVDLSDKVYEYKNKLLNINKRK